MKQMDVQIGLLEGDGQCQCLKHGINKLGSVNFDEKYVSHIVFTISLPTKMPDTCKSSIYHSIHHFLRWRLCVLNEFQVAITKLNFNEQYHTEYACICLYWMSDIADCSG